jgi:hypothetical protein
MKPNSTKKQNKQKHTNTKKKFKIKKTAYPHFAFWRNEYIRDLFWLRTIGLLKLFLRALIAYLPITGKN